MLKFLLLVALIALAIWLYRKSNGGRPVNPPQAPVEAENMVICGHCGVRFPASETFMDADIQYCCDEHRRAGHR